ncbi:MAG: hypothetical protein ACLQHS_01330 [Candidatus Limnocylindrales bacterium]
MIFDRFDATGEWPLVAALQHELARQHNPFDVVKSAHDLDPYLGRVTNALDGRAILTIKGVRRCRGSEVELADFLGAVRYFLARYLEADEDRVAVTREEVENALGLSGERSQRLALLIETSMLGLGGGGTAESWNRIVDDQIRRYDGVQTIDQLLRRMYPARRTAAPPALPGSASGVASLAGQLGQQAAATPALLDWPAAPPGWGPIEGRLGDLGARLRTASSRDDWREVGVRAREILRDVADVAYEPWMSPTEQPPPTGQDVKGRLDVYFAARLPLYARDFAAFVRATWALANALTHADNMGATESYGASQAVMLLVRIVQQVEFAAHSRPQPRYRARRAPRAATKGSKIRLG